MRYENEYCVYDDETRILQVKDGISEFHSEIRLNDLYDDMEEVLDHEVDYRVILPDSAKIIYDDAFAGMKMSSIELPDSIICITASAFCRCLWLKRIVWPSKAHCMDNKTFLHCTYLEEVELPEGLLVIGDDAFRECSSLKEIVIPSTVEEFGVGVFWGCTSLKSIHVPKSLYNKYDQNNDYFKHTTNARVIIYDEPIKKPTVGNTKSPNVTVSTIEAVSTTTKKFKSFNGVIRKNLIAEKKKK